VSAEPLLTIDVDAELRKVAQAAAEGPLHLPAELVRRAVAARATRVDLTIERRALTARDDGEPVPSEDLRLLALLVDPAASSTARHRALVALEPRPACLALAGLDADLRVETGRPGGRFALSKERGRRPATIAQAGRQATSGTVVTVRGLTLDPVLARKAVQAACRFSPIPVFVDGHEVARGFRDVVAEDALPSPLEGRVGLPRSGEAGSLLLLHDGVISSRSSVPDAPAFEAVVEMRALAASKSGGALREAIVPYLGAVVDAAVGLALRLGARLAELEPADQARVRALLLTAARKPGRRSEVFRLPLVRALVGREGEARWLSLLDLAGDREVTYLEPGQDPASFLLPDRPVLVLDAEDRGRLAPLLALRFRAPGRRRVASPLSASLRRAEATTVTWVLRLARRLRHPRLGAEASERALTASERALLSGLRSCLPGHEVVMTDGAGPVRALGPRRWAIPRRSPDVAACAKALARDPAWAYPAVLALVGGRAPMASAARAAWRSRFLTER
jgi:hypothetical protein